MYVLSSKAATKQNKIQNALQKLLTAENLFRKTKISY